ncbi:MAG: PD40 domain-containing protein [Chloroflexi bacterium]|nr:PD40 domain-containing protein [Chloroflexota bacterium]
MRPIYLLMVIATLLFVACRPTKDGARIAPTPTQTAVMKPKPEATPAKEGSLNQLAYADGEGSIWIINADGSGKKKLIDSERCPYATFLSWSPRGDRLVCRGVNPDKPLPRPEPSLNNVMVVVDINGRILKETEFMGSFAWSPTGHYLAYSVLRGTATEITARYYVADAEGNAIASLDGVEGDIVWSPDGSSLAYNAERGKVVIYDVNTGTTRTLGIGIDRALAWVLDGKAILVASQYREGDGMGIRYEASLLDLASGQLARLAQFDNGIQFWMSLDSQSAVFISGFGEAGLRLSILDFATLTVTPIVDSTISYPSERIPSSHVAFSPDSSHIYWADAKLPKMAVYRAQSNGTGLTTLATLPSLHMRFSSDFTMIAYVVGGNPPTLWVAKIDGSGAIQIGPLRNTFAWRPQ